MRWLVVHPGPNFSVADVYNGWAEALRALGEQVIEYNLDRRLSFYDAALIDTGDFDDDGHPGVRKALTRQQAIELAANGILSACYQAWPDVVLFVSAFFTPPQMLDVIRSRRHRVVLLHTESPYQDEEQLERAGHADINLLNDPVNIGAYQALGVPAVYMPHAYRKSVHYPPRPRGGKKWDFTFIGTGFPSRVRFFEAMDLAGLDVHLAGPWLELPEGSPLRDWTATDPDDCVDNAQAAEIYRQARTGLNFYRRESEDTHTGEGWACGPREIELAACGLWFTRDPRPESDGLFPMLPSYTTPGEASDQIRWALTHPDQRQQAAAEARAAIEERTFTNNAKALLRMISKG